MERGKIALEIRIMEQQNFKLTFILKFKMLVLHSQNNLDSEGPRQFQDHICISVQLKMSEINWLFVDAEDTTCLTFSVEKETLHPLFGNTWKKKIKAAQLWQP